MRRIYLEVGPLKEKYFTGIAQVTAALAGEALLDHDHDIRFFVGRTLIGRDAVEELLLTRDGDLLDWHLHRRPMGVAPEGLSEKAAAIFPNRKTCRRVFGGEFQIVHDLSTLLTPQFHHQETIDWHAKTMEADIQTNLATFCVSDATRDDVRTYFPIIPADRVVTLHLAADTPSEKPEKYADVEAYILVVGTIEPRKNIVQVLRFIKANPSCLLNYRFIFLGRFGWGETIESTVKKFELEGAVSSQRVIFPGFVDETIKTALMLNATLVIYPSLFEGFGLPVLEALACGTPCLTTRSSSLPEIAGDAAFYFDPFNDQDFSDVFPEALEVIRNRYSDIQAKCLRQAARFTWRSTYRRMMNVVDSLMEA